MSLVHFYDQYTVDVQTLDYREDVVSCLLFFSLSLALEVSLLLNSSKWGNNYSKAGLHINFLKQYHEFY